LGVGWLVFFFLLLLLDELKENLFSSREPIEDFLLCCGWRFLASAAQASFADFGASVNVLWSAAKVLEILFDFAAGADFSVGCELEGGLKALRYALEVAG